MSKQLIIAEKPSVAQDIASEAESLIRAAEAGKQVACVIELKARFDEARNLLWAQELQQVGARRVLGREQWDKAGRGVRQHGFGRAAKSLQSAEPCGRVSLVEQREAALAQR